MRLRRRILRIILFLLAVPVILCGALYGFHKISLWAESRKYPPVGKMVEVNGHQTRWNEFLPNKKDFQACRIQIQKSL